MRSVLWLITDKGLCERCNSCVNLWHIYWLEAVTRKTFKKTQNLMQESNLFFHQTNTDSLFPEGKKEPDSDKCFVYFIV